LSRCGGYPISFRTAFNPKVLAEGMAKYRVEGLSLSHLYGRY